MPLPYYGMDVSTTCRSLARFAAGGKLWLALSQEDRENGSGRGTLPPIYCPCHWYRIFSFEQATLDACWLVTLAQIGL